MATIESEIRQVADREIVKGAVPLATVAVNPTELARRLEIKWSAGSDELGVFHRTVLEARGTRYVLLSYDESDPPAITLLGVPDQVTDLEEPLRSLRVADDEVIDRIDHLPDPGQIATTVSNLQLQVLNQAVEQIRDRVRNEIKQLSAQIELSRLASLASIEEIEITPRQREVLQRVVSGLSPSEVAAELQVSRATVQSHLRTLRNILVHQH